MTTYRKIQSGSKALAICWGFSPAFDPKILKGLAGFAVVASSEAPPTVTQADFLVPRRMVGAPDDQPLILIGAGGGGRTVKAAIVSKLADPWGVALLEKAPAGDYGLAVDQVAERAAAGLGVYQAASPDQPLDAALDLLAAFADGPPPPAVVRPVAAQDPAAAWRDKGQGLGARLVNWTAAGADRASTFDGLPLVRRYVLDKAANRSALAFSYGLIASAFAGEPHPRIRATGLELEQDARLNGTWTTDPAVGSLAIMGPEPLRRVGVVSVVEGASVAILGAFPWGESRHTSDATILGYIPLG